MLLSASTPQPPFPTPVLPSKALHAQYTVEVNKRGQVVRVDHGTFSGDRAFDTMTLGNAMQMWIRKPNGRVVIGLYRVRYDYDPRSHRVTRIPSLIARGGKWANRPGAATQIIAEARRQTQQTYARLRAEQKKHEREAAKSLPDIKAAVRRAVAKPTPRP